MTFNIFKKFEKLRREYDKEKFYEKFVRYARIILFAILIFVEILILFGGKYENLFWGVVGIELLITGIFAIKTWAVKKYSRKIVCYVADTLLLLSLTAISGSEYLLTLYTVILTEFYLSEDNFVSGCIMFACSLFFYCVAYALSAYFSTLRALTVGVIISQCFNSLVFLSLHFFIENIAIMLYRHSVETEKKNKELDETNKKLQTAYEDLKEVALLQERQRIAKDIHDTAGHSITICIMQTEAAKMLMDSDPAAAKKNLVAANIQAKHALDELRESVHLLSGRNEQVSLRDSLLNIITDSTAGTGIKIRSAIEDIALEGDARRLVENTLKEGISNGLRHGKATAFYFEFSKKGEKIYFLLSDNGIGADLEGLKLGLGLYGLKKRVEEQGGEVFFRTEIDEGFEIHMTLPFFKEEIKND